MLCYNAERNVQIIISLLKAHGVKKVVVSPGATNVCLVESMRYDGAFEMISCVDERSAAYIACGLAEESGELVALSCTGATASRNYISGLTEAYYRKLPIIAITATLHEGRLYQNYPQQIDRSMIQKDISVKSVNLNYVNDDEDAWTNNLLVNEALIAAKKHGGGPVHINWVTKGVRDYSVTKLPDERIIKYYTNRSVFPNIATDKVAIFIGAHSRFDNELEEVIDDFCEAYNGVVLCDQTSNYRGKYRVLGNLVTYQELYKSSCLSMPLLIYLGNVSGAYMTLKPQEVWRVNIDGESRDFFKRQTKIFEMDELEFFSHYTTEKKVKELSYYNSWKNEYERLREKIPDVLPFSNIYVAKQLAGNLPDNSVLHLGILNSLRAWNFFETPKTVTCFSNTGGFGIDGCLSSLVGAALANPQKLYFGCIGDLAFFYDMNVLGNRHLGKNIRLIIINNGRGTEFRNYNHNAALFPSDETDLFVAAANHFGAQSDKLIKDYAEDLGLVYLSASNEQEFMENVNEFLVDDGKEKSIVFEVFTDSFDESDALRIINTLETTINGSMKSTIKKMLGNQGVENIRKIIKR